MLSSKKGVHLRSGFELGKGGKFFQDSGRDILNLVFWLQNVNQRSIADVTKIPQLNVSRLVKYLMERGELYQTDCISSTFKGNPNFELVANPQFAYCFGLSILLNAISLVLMDFAGNVLKHA